MWGSKTRKAAVAAAAVGGGGAAALAARLAVRRREVNWSPPERVRSQPYLSVELLGHGDAPVLLLHPLSGSAEYFGSAFDELGDPGPLVVPDLLGFGSSPRPDEGYGPDQQVDAVVHSLDGLEIPGPALWVGHGFGGVLALRAAASHPGGGGDQPVAVFGPRVRSPSSSPAHPTPVRRPSQPEPGRGPLLGARQSAPDGRPRCATAAVGSSRRPPDGTRA
jgi:pimeloyl-ACP methyl ester carboxylesterase